MNTSENSYSAQIQVELGERSYPIKAGFDILKGFGSELRKLTQNDRVVIVTNNLINGHYGDALTESLSAAEFVPETLLIPDGEQFKSIDTLVSIYNFLVDYHYSRETMIIALGGGIVGDITGYAAASYMRGIDFVQIPTTLLAMVDSSVGGKTGVNHPHGKNMIGAFHQPKLVFADCLTLKTLSPREFRAGFAEVIKYGVIWSADFFNYCRDNRDEIFNLEAQSIIKVIQQSCEIKAEVVAKDEREAGLRAILNFGHTIGHALEAVTRYDTYKHGEAIAIGMIAEARLAVLMGLCETSVADQLEELVNACGLPVKMKEGLDPEDIVDHMKRDKKVRRGKIRIVLPTAIGTVEIRDDISLDKIIDALKLVES